MPDPDKNKQTKQDTTGFKRYKWKDVDQGNIPEEYKQWHEEIPDAVPPDDPEDRKKMGWKYRPSIPEGKSYADIPAGHPAITRVTQQEEEDEAMYAKAKKPLLERMFKKYPSFKSAFKKATEMDSPIDRFNYVEDSLDQDPRLLPEEVQEELKEFRGGADEQSFREAQNRMLTKFNKMRKYYGKEPIDLYGSKEEGNVDSLSESYFGRRQALFGRMPEDLAITGDEPGEPGYEEYKKAQKQRDQKEGAQGLSEGGAVKDDTSNKSGQSGKKYIIPASETTDGDPKLPVDSKEDVEDAWKMRNHVEGVKIDQSTIEKRIRQRAKELGAELPDTAKEEKSEGGVVVGQGTGKSDSIDAELDEGDFVVPADAPKDVVLYLLQELDLTHIASPDDGNVDVKLSNGEVVIPKDQIENAKNVLSRLGLTLDDLAPNADNQQGQKYAQGSFVFDKNKPDDDSKQATELNYKEEKSGYSWDGPSNYTEGSESQETKNNEADTQQSYASVDTDSQLYDIPDYDTWEQQYEKHNPIGPFMKKLKPTLNKEKAEDYEHIAGINAIGDALSSIANAVYAKEGVPMPKQKSTAKGPLNQYRQMIDSYEKRKAKWDRLNMQQAMKKYNQYQDYKSEKLDNLHEASESAKERQWEYAKMQDKQQHELTEQGRKWSNKAALARFKELAELKQDLAEQQSNKYKDGLTLYKEDPKEKGVGYQPFGRITEDEVMTAFNQIRKHPQIQSQINDDIKLLKAKFGDVSMDDIKLLVQDYWNDYTTLTGEQPIEPGPAPNDPGNDPLLQSPAAQSVLGINDGQQDNRETKQTKDDDSERTYEDFEQAMEQWSKQSVSNQ